MMAQLEGMLGQFAQTQDPNLAVEICNTLVQAMGLGADAGAPPMDPSMQGGAPPMDPTGGAPMGRQGMQMPQAYRQGGKMPRTFRKV